MAELAQIKRKALAARRFEVPMAGRADAIITLQVPTKHETMVSYLDCGTGAPAANSARWQRVMLERAIVAWRGLRVGDLLATHEAAAEDLPFDPEAIALLLDAQDEWATQLFGELMPRLEARQAVQDTAEKNS
jgi:hypothetical protein